MNPEVTAKRAAEVAVKASQKALNLHVWKDPDDMDSRMAHLGIRYGVAREICDAFGVVNMDPSWLEEA